MAGAGKQAAAIVAGLVVAASSANVRAADAAAAYPSKPIR